MTAVVLYYLAATLLMLIVLGCWLTTILTLPGNWLIVGFAALFVWWFGDGPERGMGWTTVGVLAALAAVGEVIEFVAGAAGAAKQGASRRAVVLSLVGALVGGLAGFFVGAPILVIGPLIVGVLGGAVGAFVGAYVGETWKGRSESERWAAGQGAFVGKIWGTVAKVAVGAVMIVVVAIDAFF